MEISDCRKKLNMNYDMSQIVAHRFKKTWASISFFIGTQNGMLMGLAMKKSLKPTWNY